MGIVKNWRERDKGLITLEAKENGKHGTHPPLEEITAAVIGWLCRFNHDKLQLLFRMTVECCRLPASFTGVKLVRFPEDNLKALDIWVRPKNSQDAYKCRLVCPNDGIAGYIITGARPMAAQYMDWHIRKNHQSTEVKVDSRDLAHKRRQRQSVNGRNQLRLTNKLKATTVLRQFCSSVYEKMGRHRVVSGEIIKQMLSQTLGQGQ